MINQLIPKNLICDDCDIVYMRCEDSPLIAMGDLINENFPTTRDLILDTADSIGE
jgi:hypothetical protein